MRKFIPFAADDQPKFIPLQEDDSGHNRITCAQLGQVLLSKEESKLVIIDCRFPYEFEGGHIKGAINLPTREAIAEFFFGNEDRTRELMKSVIVFHCEFSQSRGPGMY